MNTINHPDVTNSASILVRSYFQHDEHVDLSIIDGDLDGYSKQYMSLFNNYINEEHSNHLQARELALNELRKHIINQQLFVDRP